MVHMDWYSGDSVVFSACRQHSGSPQPERAPNARRSGVQHAGVSKTKVQSLAHLLAVVPAQISDVQLARQHAPLTASAVGGARPLLPLPCLRVVHVPAAAVDRRQRAGPRMERLALSCLLVPQLPSRAKPPTQLPLHDRLLPSTATPG